MGRMAITTLSCFDFRLRSEIDLPELLAAAQDDPRPVVDIRLGHVPESLPGAAAPAWGVERAGPAALLTVSSVARYLIEDGESIVVDPFPGASERRVRLFLLGSALGILCFQRGLLPLHANAIVADGAGYAFAGPSGAGKSTLAGHFSRAGYEVLCDDVCAVTLGPDRRPLIWPGLPRVKLWHDAAEVLGHETAGLDRVAEEVDKYHVGLPPPRREGPVPLRRLYLLERAEGDSPGAVAPLRGQQAMQALMAQTYRREYLAPLGLVAQHFHLCAAVAAEIEVCRLERAWGYQVFDRELARLRAHIEA